MPKLLKAKCNSCEANIEEHAAVLCPKCVIALIQEREDMKAEIRKANTWASMHWSGARRAKARVEELEAEIARLKHD